jgi:hypothetical protein
MFHDNRTWQIAEVASAEQLARMITESTWALCNGFYVAGHPDYLFLNDATHEYAAGECGVIKGGLGADAHLQIESMTPSWCTYEKALAYIREVLAGDRDGRGFARTVKLSLETPAQHGTCPYCF